MSRRTWLKFLAAALAALLTWPLAALETAPGANAIASAHPDATAAGREVLEAGGNAFDAAVAVAAALAVVEPYSSGLGGGAFFLLHRAADGAEHFIDARETAPAAATADMFLDEHGEFVRERSLNGGLAAGIPGLPAALVHLAHQYGKLDLARSLAPAIRLAREGFETGPRYAMMAGYRAAALRASGTADAVFLVDGEAPAPGTRIVQPDLAATLASIAADDAESFYRGEIAQRLVAGANAAGGIWSLDDLATYEVRERPPIVGRYHDIRVVSAPPPSSGGIVLLEALNILERYDLAALDEATRLHVVIEAMRRAYRDRADFLGDPDFTDIPVAHLIDKDYADWLARDLTLDHATPSSSLPPVGAKPEGRDTTHFSVIDAAGNRVAATLSINTPFGSTVMPPGTGVVLNNEMDDFSAAPLTPNTYGLVGAGANSVAPHKRPLSSMTPTFVEGPTRIGILGTPGGSRIISMVLIGVLEFAAGKPPTDWVAAPRYHHQYLPDVVQYEAGGLSAELAAALTARGHTLSEVGRNYGNMQAILWDRASGKVEAASDPRGEGGADVWP
ncbi:MAG: gamma-glutamyltransferase [Gammaproteobacteria bacterium]|nr:gamma-glutamyltransferase [Gammaproteobacteria bacterium]MCP5200527.1 gamma-glutamyltransferase [Gammaproteobacteria bacterium]